MGLPRWLSGKESACDTGDIEMWVRFLVRDDPLEEEMATCSSILAMENAMDRGAWKATVYGVAES